MARFNPETYDSVESRLEKFWEANPNGRILTKLLSDANKLDEVVVEAEIYADREDTRPVATGLAFEKRGQNMSDGANFTSHLENCETSAIGRAFANWIFKAKKDSPRPSREEMRKTYQPAAPPPDTKQGAAVEAYRPPVMNGSAEIWEGPGQCPRCHAPEGKRHGRQCLEALVPA